MKLFHSCFNFDIDFCDQKIKFLSIITDATIYSVNNSFQEFRQWLLKRKNCSDRPNSEIIKTTDLRIQSMGMAIYLSRLIDAHCHFTAMD
jgi:hypothetical protein